MAFNLRVNGLFTILGMGKTVFARAIEKAQQKGWNQSDLASRLGVLPQHITNWKSRGIPPDKYVALADVLECSLDELLGRTRFLSAGSPPPPWPFATIDESKVRALSPGRELAMMEAAILLASAQLGLDVKKDG